MIGVPPKSGERSNQPTVGGVHRANYRVPTQVLRIPAEIESAIRARDVACVYCHKPMLPPASTPLRADWATIEHLDHRPVHAVSSHGPKPFDYREGQTADDFAIACQSCNSSRGAMPLWAFVVKRGIADTVAPVIKAWLSHAA